MSGKVAPAWHMPGWGAGWQTVGFSGFNPCVSLVAAHIVVISNRCLGLEPELQERETMP